MARQKAKAEATTEAVKPSEVQQQIGERKLKKLLKASADAYKDGRSIAGQLGQQIADAVEHDHLHRKAFSTLRAMDRMTPEKLAEYWDTLLYYMDISGLEERARAAPKLAFEGGDDDGDGDEAGEPDGNVAPFPAPSGKPN